MTGGRPRVVSGTPQETRALGEEMLKWVKLHRPLHLRMWYSVEKMIIYKDWKALIQLKEFLPYYEKALSMVSSAYLDKNSNVRNEISNRWQRVYFKDLRDDEDETVTFEADLKRRTELAEPTTQKEIDKDDIIMRLTHENAKLRLKQSDTDSERQTSGKLF